MYRRVERGAGGTENELLGENETNSGREERVDEDCVDSIQTGRIIGGKETAGLAQHHEYE